MSEVGECQICGRSQKLRGGKLVPHGYTRPGWGHVVGNCPGAGYAPYELSCERCASFRANIVRQIEAINAAHSKLAYGKNGVRVWRRKGHGPGNWAASPPFPSRCPSCGVARSKYESSLIMPNDPDYKRLRKSALARMLRECEGLLIEAESLTKRIQDWKLR